MTLIISEFLNTDKDQSLRIKKITIFDYLDNPLSWRIMRFLLYLKINFCFSHETLYFNKLLPILSN